MTPCNSQSAHSNHSEAQQHVYPDRYHYGDSEQYMLAVVITAERVAHAQSHNGIEVKKTTQFTPAADLQSVLEFRICVLKAHTQCRRPYLRSMLLPLSHFRQRGWHNTLNSHPLCNGLRVGCCVVKFSSLVHLRIRGTRCQNMHVHHTLHVTAMPNNPCLLLTLKAGNMVPAVASTLPSTSNPDWRRRATSRGFNETSGDRNNEG